MQGRQWPLQKKEKSPVNEYVLVFNHYLEQRKKNDFNFVFLYDKALVCIHQMYVVFLYITFELQAMLMFIVNVYLKRKCTSTLSFAFVGHCCI